MTSRSTLATGEGRFEADFDNSVIDAPVGTGGAAVGEPISVGSQIFAIVRAAPFRPRRWTPSASMSVGRINRKAVQHDDREGSPAL